jgi:hypothetical protein
VNIATAGSVGDSNVRCLTEVKFSALRNYAAPPVSASIKHDFINKIAFLNQRSELGHGFNGITLPGSTASQ